MKTFIEAELDRMIILVITAMLMISATMLFVAFLVKQAPAVAKRQGGSFRLENPYKPSKTKPRYWYMGAER